MLCKHKYFVLFKIIKRVTVTWIKKILMAGFVTAIFSNCSGPHSHYHWMGGLIESFGVYFVEKSGFVIKVSDKYTLLDYTVTDSMGVTVIKTKEHASIYQSWTLYWDAEHERLWVESSDIGMFVWQRNKNQNGFTETAITSEHKDLFKLIPYEFFNSFPYADKEFCKKNGYED